MKHALGFLLSLLVVVIFCLKPASAAGLIIVDPIVRDPILRLPPHPGTSLTVSTSPDPHAAAKPPLLKGSVRSELRTADRGSQIEYKSCMQARITYDLVSQPI